MTMTKVIVSSDIANVDWTKNAVFVPNDHKAYSNPLLIEPDGLFYIVSRKAAKLSKKIEAELTENEEDDVNINITEEQPEEDTEQIEKRLQLVREYNEYVGITEQIEQVNQEKLEQMRELYNEYLEKGCFLYSSIDGRTLSKVVMFMNYYCHSSEKIVLPEPIGNFEENVSEWDNAFIKNYVFNKENPANTMPLKMLLNASSFMAIEYLKDLLCAFTAGEIISKMNEEQMRTFFRVEDNLTPKQKEEIKEKNKYVVE